MSGVPKRSDVGIAEFAYWAQRAGTLLEQKVDPFTGRVSVTLRGKQYFDWVQDELKRHRPGRRPDKRVAEWSARIESDEFREFPSFRAKCRELAWRVYLEAGGDPDAITETDLMKLGNAYRSALIRWYEKQR